MKKINVGLNLLRIVLTFGVVLDHFWWTATPELYTGLDRTLWQLRTLAVPAFMTMTFFFSADHLRSCDGSWLKRRFVRLYEPFVFWAIVYFAVRAFVARFDPWYAVGWTDLLWQLLLGSSKHLCMQFWFHGDLIILTALFALAFRFIRAPRANVYLGIGALIVGFTLQYTPLNDAWVRGMPFEAKYPLGRLACMLPYAGAGFLLAAVKGWIDAVRGGVRVAIAVFGLWLAALCTYCTVCPDPPSVPGYAGLNMNLIAWGVLAAFYYLPFDRFPSAVSQGILAVSKYCMGVYCLHLLFGQLMFDFVFRCAKTPTQFGDMRLFSIAQCLIVWALSYVLCALIAKIPLGVFKRVVQ